MKIYLLVIMALLLSMGELVKPAQAAETVWVSSLDLSKAVQGWGATQADKAITGSPLTIAGRRYERGVGTHAAGLLAIELTGEASCFEALAGLNDTASGSPTGVVFKVRVDGKEAWNSGLMRVGDAARPVKVELRGARVLELVAEIGQGDFRGCHANWADARIILNGGQAHAIAQADARRLLMLRTPTKIWTVQSGQTAYRLRQTGAGVDCSGFAPAERVNAETALDFRPDVWGKIEGRALHMDDLELISSKGSSKEKTDKLVLTYRHRLLPLELAVVYQGWSDTGVLTRHLTLTNTGRNPLHVESMPSLALTLPAGDYELTTLQGEWGHERQVVRQPVQTKSICFVSTSGRSTALMSPWFSLQNRKTGLRYIGQLAWSGNWAMNVARSAAGSDAGAAGMTRVDLGARFDFGGPCVLAAGKKLELPQAAFAVTSGDLDDAANLLHRYQDRHVIPRNPANEPPLVQFNSWYPFPGTMTVDEMKRCVDVAKKIGAEIFVLDAGWYAADNWSSQGGDWQPNPVLFPKGTKELAQYVHGQGMLFGIWIEIEGLGIDSEAFRQHPDWCLSLDGKPVLSGARYHLDFSNPKAADWAMGQMKQMIDANQADWVKIDYNIDIGEQFCAEDGTRPGDRLLRHVQAYYAWLDKLRAAYPKLVIENCSSGGRRFDLGMLHHTHTTWLSDRTLPLPSVQLAYGATMEFIPRVCNHWMVGDEENGRVDPNKPAGWWDFMFRVPMNGQYGISSRVFDWTPEITARAKANIALYKRLRTVIASADCYHLTQSPDNEHPTGWMALQYAAPDQKKAVLMAYRLGDSEAALTCKLRGLAANQKYRITQDEQPGPVVEGKELMEKGWTVKLDEPLRAMIVELDVAE